MSYDSFLPLLRYIITAALVQTTTHQLATTQLATTYQAQQDVTPICFYQGFPGSWQFFHEGCRTSHCCLKHSSITTIYLNQTVVLKYMLNTEPYLILSKYFNKLLVVKSFTFSCQQNQHSTQLAVTLISSDGNHGNQQPTQSAIISISNQFKYL